MPSRLARWTLSRARGMVVQSHAVSEPESYLACLPNELLFAMLDVMDDKSLRLMAAVSKRFYHLATRSLLSRYDISPTLDDVTLTSSAALRALRLALTFHIGNLKALTYSFPTPTSVTQDVRRIVAVLKRFSGSSRVREVRLDFGKDIFETSGWKIGGLAAHLLRDICGDSQVGLFVANNGLFTCKPKTILGYTPGLTLPGRYWKMLIHDGSRQWVPAIRSIKTLDITYPVCSTLSPGQPWTMVVVNAVDIQTLLLHIRLSPREWSAILSSIKLPDLHEVVIWAETIRSDVSAAFLNRHPITFLQYMSPIAEPLLPGVPPLALPQLRHLTAWSHYVVHIFSGRDTRELFPQLFYVNLFPDAKFNEALHLLSLHTPLRNFALWFVVDLDPAAWPVFPNVDDLVFNNCGVDLGDSFSRFTSHLSRAFPALRNAEVKFDTR